MPIASKVFGTYMSPSMPTPAFEVEVRIDNETFSHPHPVRIWQGPDDSDDRAYIAMTCDQALDMAEWIVDTFTEYLTEEDLIRLGILKVGGDDGS